MDKLNEKIWSKDNKLIPIVREKLIVLAHKIADEVATLVEIKHIYFTGSLATYNWTPTSDIDLHVIVKILENKSNDTIREYFDLVCKLFNSHHNIFIKGYKVEVNLKEDEQLYKDKAVYDLINDEWVKEPTIQTRDINDPEVVKIAKDIQQKIDKLIASNGSADEAKALKKVVKGFRKSGLEEGEGEYSIGNLVFKKLRSTEYLAKLFNYWNQLEDQELSLETKSFKYYTNLTQR
jgi:predicted nucleotidyltransferase